MTEMLFIQMKKKTFFPQARILLYGLRWFKAYYVSQVGLELAILLPQPTES